LEIIEPFQIAGFSKIMVVPPDMTSTPLPEKDDKTYEPTTGILAKVNQIFADFLTGDTGDVGEDIGRLLLKF
jgi:hypothetical protein